MFFFVGWENCCFKPSKFLGTLFSDVFENGASLRSNDYQCLFRMKTAVLWVSHGIPIFGQTRMIEETFAINIECIYIYIYSIYICIYIIIYIDIYIYIYIFLFSFVHVDIFQYLFILFIYFYLHIYICRSYIARFRCHNRSMVPQE